MKTKDEHLNLEAIEACLTPTQKFLVHNAMDEYAMQKSMQEAIEFDRWKLKNGYEIDTFDDNEVYYYKSLSDKKAIPGKELYNLFKEREK